MWTNEGVKSMIDQYGERIFNISLNNNKTLLIGYPGVGNVNLSDISFDNIGGTDVIVINHTNISYSKPLHFKSYITTEFIEGIDVMSEEDAEYRVDPLTLK